jgi:hypothetical protein
MRMGSSSETSPPSPTRWIGEGGVRGRAASRVTYSASSIIFGWIIGAGR